MIRSGVEVYGGPTATPRPDEAAPIAPPVSSAARCRTSRRRPATSRSGSASRWPPSASGSGWPHVPSPLGRMLRMPFVPFSLLADPPFSVVEDVEKRRGRSWPRPAPTRRAGERHRQRRDHRAAGDPAGSPVPVPLLGPSRRVARMMGELFGRRARPRPCARGTPPRPARQRRPGCRELPRVRLLHHHDGRGDRQGLQLAVGHPRPRQAAGGLMAPSLPTRHGPGRSALPVQKVASAAADPGGEISTWDIDWWGDRTLARIAGGAVRVRRRSWRAATSACPSRVPPSSWSTPAASCSPRGSPRWR